MSFNLITFMQYVSILILTGHLAFVRKHTEIKDIDEGYEVEISPESQEVRQNNFFLYTSRII